MSKPLRQESLSAVEPQILPSRGEKVLGGRGVARPFNSARRGGPAGRARGQALPMRGKGRVGRGLNEAAEALLGMCVDADEDPPQPVRASSSPAYTCALQGCK